MIWAAHPDALSTLRTKIVIWWVGVPLAFAVLGLFMSGKVSSTILAPLGLVAFALMAAPFVMLFENAFTIYAITNRRALIARRASSARSRWSAATSTPWTTSWKSWRPAAAPATFISPRDGRPKLRDVDHTGKLAFRDVGKVHEVAKILEKARR